jgi:hypothetical protein
MIKAKFYAHSDKDSNFSQAEELGLRGEAFNTFRYCGYEIEFDIEIDDITGETHATHVGGIKLEQPLQMA